MPGLSGAGCGTQGQPQPRLWLWNKALALTAMGRCLKHIHAVPVGKSVICASNIRWCDVMSLLLSTSLYRGLRTRGSFRGPLCPLLTVESPLPCVCYRVVLPDRHDSLSTDTGLLSVPPASSAPLQLTPHPASLKRSAGALLSPLPPRLHCRGLQE